MKSFFKTYMYMILFVLNLPFNINKFIIFRAKNLNIVKEITLEKSKSENPMLGFDKEKFYMEELLLLLLIEILYMHILVTIHQQK